MLKMNQTIAAYQTWLQSWAASDRTVQIRSRMAATRLEEWGLDGFTTQAVQEFLGRPGLSKWTKATYYSHLNCFCGWLVQTGRLEETPMENVRRPRQGASLPHPLSESEANRVLGAARGDMRAWLLLAMLSGLRAHEIAKLRGEDVQKDCLYVEGKGGTRAMLPTHPDLWALAQDYPRRGWWFPSGDGPISADTVSSRTGKHFRALGVSGSIHRGRHLYATRLLRAGANIRVVQRLMRHSSLATTATYCAVDEDEMRAAVNLLPSNTETKKRG